MRWILFLSLLFSACGTHLQSVPNPGDLPVSVPSPLPTPSSSPEPEHVLFTGPLNFLVAGQSNAVSAGGKTWAMLPALLGQSISFTNVAHDGSDLAGWLSTFHAGLENALKSRVYTAILWVQGEEDGYERTDAKTCYQAMKTLIAASRAIQPGIPWFVSLDGAGPSSDINLPIESVPVRQAQEQIIAGGLAYQGADLDSLRSIPADFDNPTVLFDLAGNGYLAHAQLWQAVLAPYLGE